MIEEPGRRLAFESALVDARVGVGCEVLLLYLLPLLGLFAAAMLAARLALSESLIILAGLGGFVLAGFAVRWRSQPTADGPALQPMVLRAMLAGPSGP